MTHGKKGARRLVKRLVGLCLTVCVLWGAGTLGAHAASDVVYTQNNIFVAEQVSRGEMVYKASYSGWVDLRPPFMILPAGSKVTVGKSRHGFSLLAADGKEIIFEYKRNLPMPVAEYIAKITSDKPFNLDRFDKADRAGIKAGKVSPGMSKGGVIAALGYPPVHKVLSLEDNAWTYWKDRYRTLVIEFKNDRVVKVNE